MIIDYFENFNFIQRRILQQLTLALGMHIAWYRANRYIMQTTC